MIEWHFNQQKSCAPFYAPFVFVRHRTDDGMTDRRVSERETNCGENVIDSFILPLFFREAVIKGRNG